VLLLLLLLDVVSCCCNVFCIFFKLLRSSYSELMLSIEFHIKLFVVVL